MYVLCVVVLKSEPVANGSVVALASEYGILLDACRCKYRFSGF